MQRGEILAGALVRRCLAAALVTAMSAGCSGQPQLGRDEQVRKTADALWTAVCAKQPKLVEDAAQRLRQLHAEGKLSDPALAALEDVIDSANGSDWAAAQKTLKAFWRGQRPSKQRAALKTTKSPLAQEEAGEGQSESRVKA